MALLNKSNIHYFGNEGPELRLGSSLMHFYDFEDTDYWYIDFRHGWHLIAAIDFIPEKVRDKIRNGNITLLLNNSHEAYHDSIEFIYRYFVMDLNFPPSNIRLLTESASILEEVDRVSKVFDKPYIQVEWLRIFEYNVKQATRMDNYRKLNTLEIKQYDKKYLNLNRRWRQHRPILVGLLELRGLLDKGYVSFCKNVDGHNWSTVYDYLEGSVQYCDPDLYNLFQSNRDRIENIPNMFLDTTELYINQVHVDNNLDYHYENTYFSIVNETNYFKNLGEGLFLSEKVFKPILRCHPFILVSRPHSLRKLKEIGYKTFSPYIDESYDEEVNDYERLKMIVNEIERLSNLSEPQLVEFLTAVKEIVEHNYQLLTSKSSELKDNFVTALT